MVPPARGSAPHPAPGSQEHQSRRFELARSLSQRHSRLASQRAIAALLLVLASLLLFGIELWLVFTVPVGSFGFPWWEHLFTLVFLVFVLVFLLVALGVALAAVLWKHNPAGQAGPASAVFFRTEGAAIPDEAQFSQSFRDATQEQMLQGALQELASLARYRRRQEMWLRISIVFLFLASLGLCKQAVLAAML